MGVLENKAFHIVLITKGNVDHRKVLDKVLSCSSLGFKKFIIHVLTKEDRPLYFEKIRDIIFENIAFTLIIKYHKMSHVNLNKFLNELRSKPHEVIEV